MTIPWVFPFHSKNTVATVADGRLVLLLSAAANLQNNPSALMIVTTDSVTLATNLKPAVLQIT